MAIAFVAAATSGNLSGDDPSFAYTTGSGSDRALFVDVYDEAGDDTDRVTGVTYGGVACTLFPTGKQLSSTLVYHSCWYLAAPATGANTLLIQTSDAGFSGEVNVADYTGVDQSTPLDVSNKGTAVATSVTVSVTTVKNNDWLIGGTYNSTGLGVAGANTTIRVAGGASNEQLHDSNANQTPPGSFSQSLSMGGSTNWNMVVGAFMPVQPKKKFLMFMNQR